MYLRRWAHRGHHRRVGPYRFRGLALLQAFVLFEFYTRQLAHETTRQRRRRELVDWHLRHGAKLRHRAYIRPGKLPLWL